MGFDEIHQFAIMSDVLQRVSFFKRNTEPTMDLLLLFNEDVHHYVLINNLIELGCAVKEKQFTNSLPFCRNCFAFPTLKSNINFTMNSCRFIKFKARWIAPFIIYFDFESFLKPVSSCPDNPDASSTEVVEQHIPSGFALTLIKNRFSTPKEFVINSFENCVTNSVKKTT